MRTKICDRRQRLRFKPHQEWESSSDAKRWSRPSLDRLRGSWQPENVWGKYISSLQANAAINFICSDSTAASELGNRRPLKWRKQGPAYWYLGRLVLTSNSMSSCVLATSSSTDVNLFFSPCIICIFFAIFSNKEWSADVKPSGTWIFLVELQIFRRTFLLSSRRRPGVQCCKTETFFYERFNLAQIRLRIFFVF